MKIVVTGHRPQKLGGFNNKKAHTRIYSEMQQMIGTLAPHVLYTGMALGVDQWAAQICLYYNIPFIAAVPFAGQDLKWPQASRERYRALIRKAAQVVEVDRQPGYISERVPPGIYHATKLFTRNRWMVDQLDNENDQLLAVVTQQGQYNSGSAGTINYFRQSRGSQKVATILCDKLIDPKHDPLDDVPF